MSIKNLAICDETMNIVKGTKPVVNCALLGPLILKVPGQTYAAIYLIGRKSIELSCFKKHIRETYPACVPRFSTKTVTVE